MSRRRPRGVGIQGSSSVLSRQPPPRGRCRWCNGPVQYGCTIARHDHGEKLLTTATRRCRDNCCWPGEIGQSLRLTQRRLATYSGLRRHEDHERLWDVEDESYYRGF